MEIGGETPLFFLCPLEEDREKFVTVLQMDTYWKGRKTTLFNNTTYNTNRILVFTTEILNTLKKNIKNWFFFQCISLYQKYWIKYNDIKIINHKPELKTTFCWSSIKTKNLQFVSDRLVNIQNLPRWCAIQTFVIIMSYPNQNILIILFRIVFNPSKKNKNIIFSLMRRCFFLIFLKTIFLFFFFWKTAYFSI